MVNVRVPAVHFHPEMILMPLTLPPSGGFSRACAQAYAGMNNPHKAINRPAHTACFIDLSSFSVRGAL